MKYRSVFDIIGPVMVGPSSSHTAGAARIGKLVRQLFDGKPDWVHIHLYGSFKETYKGHGTDIAIVGGILGFDTDDERIKRSFTLAEKEKIQLLFVEESEEPIHPNTVKIRIGNENKQMEVVGISIGGGKIEITEIDGNRLQISGNYPVIYIVNEDRFGVLAAITSIFAEKKLNVGNMQVIRNERTKQAMMIIEIDQPVHESLLIEIRNLPNVRHVVQLAE